MDLFIKEIKKSFGKKHVLSDINVVASKGQCIGILGVNGSGKSTLFNVLAGISKCDAGSFVYNGVDLFSNKSQRSKLIGYVTQSPPLIDELSGRDNLRLWYTNKQIKSELENGVLGMLGINEFIDTTVSKMSGGMKKRLAIGCAVCNNPQILLLDEPSAALDLVCKQSIFNYLEDFKKRGGIILIATHDTQDLPLCDKMYILKDGSSNEYSYNGDVEELVGKLQ